jgi:hypothetical protein
MPKTKYQTLTMRERVELQRRKDKDRLMTQKIKANLNYQPANQSTQHTQLTLNF